MKPGSLLASRFRVIRTLGKGGMSTVYEALDTHLDRRVALKTIRRAEGFSLLRFKEEFRSLASLRHRNLVALYDLAADGEAWFFTMELVEGIDLVSHIASLRETSRAFVVSFDPDGSDDGERGHREPGRETRRLLAEIAAALAYLHERGTVHRDIKPSNILVDPMARPRILDFGIARFLGAAEEVQQALQLRKVGTPGYVAPEQIRGQARPESDIYSLGVILYRILTGQLPFRGRKKDVLRAHMNDLPVPPARAAAGVDPVLSALAMRMLAKDPAQRPTAVELSQLERPVREAEFEGLVEDEGGAAEVPLVGRERELREVLGHLLELTVGGPLLVGVEGPSGIGKTRLAEEVMAMARVRGLRCLFARCYEREQIPYKAVDAIVDQVVGATLADDDPELLLAGIEHEGLVSLARLFPFAAELPIPGLEEASGPEGHERKFAAFDALIGLLAAAGGQAGLVIVIDDLQWADEGSFELLRHLLERRGPRLGILATVRPGEGALPGWLTEDHPASPLRIRRVQLGPIGRDEAEALAAAISSMREVPGPIIDQIADEAQGNPLVLEELVRFYLEYGDAERAADGGAPMTFSEMVRRRLDALGPSAGAVMEVCVSAGYALGLGELAAGARLPVQAASSAAADLLERRLLRQVAGREGTIRLCPFHDRATRVAMERVEPSQRRRVHRRLAAYLEGARPGEFHALADHWRMAGVPERASTYALRAAERAEEMALLPRAIRYYALALGCTPPGVEEWRIRVRLAEALDRSGRFTEAGQAFRDAARRAPTADRGALMLRGARTMLKSGDLDTAVGTMERVSEQLWSEPLIRGRRASWAAVGMELVRERLDRRRRDRGDGDDVDLCLELAGVLRFLAPARSIQLSVRALRLARRQGDPVMRARALTAAAASLALLGRRGTLRRADRMLGRAEALFAGEPDAVGRGVMYAVQVQLAATQCRWDAMRASTHDALEAFADEGQGRSWHAQMTRVLSALGEVDAGDLARAERLVLALLPPHHDWSDPSVAGWVRWVRARVDLVFNRWDDAERLCRAGLRATTGRRDAAMPLWLRYRGGLAVALAGSGRVDAGVTTIARTRAVLERAPWLDPVSRGELDHCGALVYGIAARQAHGGARGRQLARAMGHARRLRSSRLALYRARGQRFVAETALTAGRPQRAITQARTAVEELLATRQRFEATQALLVQARAERTAGHEDAERTRRSAASQLAEILRLGD